MIPPAISDAEPERLAALHGLRQLDTPAEERFDRITRLAQRLFDVPITLVSLVDEDRQWFKSAQGLLAPETSREVSFCGHTILEDRCFVIEDAHEDPRFHDNPLVTGPPHIRFYAGYPVHSADGHRVGTLCLIDRAPRTMTEDEQDSLRDLAEIVDVELERQVLRASEVRLRAELAQTRQRAAVDCLTRLWNRGAVLELLQDELERSCIDGSAVSVTMLDIDHFKSINDRFGHPGGDEVLRTVAERIRRAVSADTAVGRFGGEEFVVVASAGSVEAARAQAERIRYALDVAPVQLEAGRCPVTASLGVWVGVPTSDTTVDRVLAAADAALYRAKANGRNRVEMGTPQDGFQNPRSDSRVSSNRSKKPMPSSKSPEYMWMRPA